MTITRKSLADTIDEYDAAIADLQSSKRDTFNSYRADLTASGMPKEAIKAEIEAAKKAIRRRQIIAAKSAEVVEEADALAEEFFEEITAVRAPRATRVENIEEFDPETGEVFDAEAEAAQAVIDRLKSEPLSNPPETATQSTAALTEVPLASHVMGETPESRRGVAAGTQAPPVDTNSQAKASTGNADSLAVRDGRETDHKVAAQVGSGEASRLSVGSGTDAPIPTPAGGGNTTEPDDPNWGSDELARAIPETVFAADRETGGEQSSPAPVAKRHWKFNDPAHSDCLNPDQCGGFSNLKLCPGCAAEALSARQVA